MKKILVVLSLFLMACSNNPVQENKKINDAEVKVMKITDIRIASVEKSIDMSVFRQNLSSKLNDFFQKKSKEEELSSVIVEDSLVTKEDFYKYINNEFEKRNLDKKDLESTINRIFSEILVGILYKDVYGIMVEKMDKKEELLAVYIVPNKDFDEFHIIVAYGDGL